MEVLRVLKGYFNNKSKIFDIVKIFSVTILLLSKIVIGGEIVKVGHQPDGSIIVSTNQVLKPAGTQITFSGRPVDLALSPDETTLAVMNQGMNELILIDTFKNIIKQIIDIKVEHNYVGIIFSRDGKTIYSSDAKGNIQVITVGKNSKWAQQKPIIGPKGKNIGPNDRGEAIPCVLAQSEDEKYLYVALSRNNTLGIIELATGKTIAEIQVGIAPFAVVAIDDKKAYVSNWGGRIPGKDEPTAITCGGQYGAGTGSGFDGGFGLMENAGSKILIDPKTGIANSGTVSVVDLLNKKVIKSIPVGLHPSELVLSPDKKRLYVANANSDIVSAIDTTSDKVVKNICVKPNKGLPFGSAPNALVMNPDGKTLYVANGGNNAIAVISLKKNKVMGFIPTDWYPGAVKVNNKGTKLYAANIKGVGLRDKRHPKGYRAWDHLGSVLAIDLPINKKKLEKFTREVKKNNRFRESIHNLLAPRKNVKPIPVPERHEEPSIFKYVLYIIKENQTYDPILGDMPQGNGDPSLCLFGREVTPNHHALAEQFVLLDNYYCSSKKSMDGHHWCNEAYATDYIEKSLNCYTRGYPSRGEDALAPASSGFLWDNALRHGLSFRTYGEFVQTRITPANATFMDIYNDYKNGTNKVKVENVGANVETLEPYMNRKFAEYFAQVPDVHKAKVFIEEFRKFEKEGNLPNLMIVALPNDHTAGTRPGFPTPRASIADNDLALGQIVEAVTHSKFWQETVIFVIQDDPQGGPDHVDGHRSLCFVISPYTKRRAVDSTYYTQTGVIKTIELVLGLPAMNQLDLLATPLKNCFQSKPDFRPYKALPNKIPLDELNPPLKTLKGNALEWAKKSIELPIDELGKKDEDDDETLRRIIWHAVKGYDVPYPKIKKGEI